MSEKDLNYYMSLPYKVEIVPEGDGEGFNASIPDLKGCVAVGDTVEEAYQIIAEVKQTWIEIALDRGWQIPEPIPEEIKEYSGKFNVRLPRFLHRKLAEFAKVESTSLNQLVVALLAEGAERIGARIKPVEKPAVIEQQAVPDVTYGELTPDPSPEWTRSLYKIDTPDSNILH